MDGMLYCSSTVAQTFLSVPHATDRNVGATWLGREALGVFDLLGDV